MDRHYSLTGLLVGAIVGSTGVGRGSLMTPSLVMVFGVAPTTGIGTDLLYAPPSRSRVALRARHLRAAAARAPGRCRR
jgi:uncharacterized protein